MICSPGQLWGDAGSITAPGTKLRGCSAALTSLCLSAALSFAWYTAQNGTIGEKLKGRDDHAHTSLCLSRGVEPGAREAQVTALQNESVVCESFTVL